MDYINNLFPITTTQVEELFQNGKKQFETNLQELLAEDFQLETLTKMDDIYYQFDKIGSIVSILNNCHPEKEIRDLSRQYETDVKNLLNEQLFMNKVLYQKIKGINPDLDKLSEGDRYYYENTVLDMEKNGLHLPDDQLENVKNVEKEIVELGSQFDNNIQELQSRQVFSVTKDQLAGISDETFMKSHWNEEKQVYELGVDYPTYVMIMKHCDIVETRKTMYQNKSQLASPENNDVLDKLFATRHKLANMLGFDNYCDYELSSQMVKNSQNVIDFHDKIAPNIQEKSKNELQLLKNHFKLEEFAPWDIAYYTNKYNKEVNDLDENKLNTYFPVNQIFQKILDVYTMFFGLTFTEVPQTEINLWHKSVKIVNVFYNDKLLGNIICDLYPRDNKFNHMCCCAVNVNQESGETHPAVALVIANFPEDYFTHQAVTTFFHEFGHAIHYLNGTSKYKSQAGFNTKMDFIECPSQLLEEWIWDKKVLQTMTSIPEDLIDKKIKYRHTFSGLSYIGQIILGQVSFHYHYQHMDNTEQRHAFYKEMFEKYKPDSKYDPSVDISTNFGHLYGYGSRYYGYLWSRMISIDMLNKIKSENGLLDAKMGRLYIDTVLSKGGSKNPFDMMKDFLGTDQINFNALDSWFNE